MKTRIVFFLLPALIVTQYACQSKKFFATPPDYRPDSVSYVPKPSIINLPITIPMLSVNQAINGELKGLIYEDNDYSNNNGDNLMVKVWRTKKEIKVDGYKEKIRIMLPLEIWASYRWQGCSFCPTIEKATDFEMDITLNTVLRIGNDWQALLTTTATDITFSKEPKLDFSYNGYGIQIPITRVVKTALMANLPAITAEIDKQVEENVPIKQYLSETWEQIQEPILLDSVYKAWLVMVPEKIFISPLSNDVNKIKLNAGISAFVETKLGAKPKLKRSTQLSAPVIQDKIDKKFEVEIPVSIDFDMATELARKNLKDSTFQLDNKKKITVNDIEVYGKGGDVFIKTDLSGSFNGLVYMRGKPAIDTVTNKIYFKDLDFDINTKNALYKIAAWMAHGTIKKIFQKQFVYNVGDDLKAAENSVQTYLDGYTYDNLVTVNGRMGKLRLKEIFCNEEEIMAIFTAFGSASVNIESLVNPTFSK